MFIGEGPGKEENFRRVPFCGKSGQELDRYLWRSCHLGRDQVYVTNLVKYHVPDDEDPTEEDIRRDAPELEQEILSCNPAVVVTLGRHSTRRFLGGADMESVHGIAHRCDGRIILPVFHPAAGLHNTEFQAKIWWDFEQLGKGLKSGFVLRARDEYPRPRYKEIGPREVLDVPGAAVDTEGSADKPWCLTFSNRPGWALCSRRPQMKFRGKVILHNSLHDLAVLRAMRIDLDDDQFDDSMLKAYELGVEPQGLKALALRHCGMVMRDYDDLVGPKNRELALKWLSKVYSKESVASGVTTKRTRTRTSVSAGRKLKRTSRKPPKR